MVKTRVKSHAQINRDQFTEAIKIFGKTLTRRKTTENLNTFGEVTSITNSDTAFVGDLQKGVELDEQLLTAGFVESGEAVLYIHPDALSVEPSEQNIIINGSGVGTFDAWEIIEEIERPELEGSVVHKSYRCKRRDSITLT